MVEHSPGMREVASLMPWFVRHEAAHRFALRQHSCILPRELKTIEPIYMHVSSLDRAAPHPAMGRATQIQLSMHTRQTNRVAYICDLVNYLANMPNAITPVLLVRRRVSRLP